MTSSLRRCSLLALCLLAQVACQQPAAPYGWVSPPEAAAPAALTPEHWSTHLEEDLLPYWRMEAAWGSPVGNFPTYRGMDGSVQGSTWRKPRMLGRQTFTYAIGYLITGDETLLDLSRAGSQWLLAHGQDTERGGWHADLLETGEKANDDPKFSQDMSYAVMGPAAYFFVTRDPAAEAAVLATRDLLFDPAKFWDAESSRIRDGMDATLSTEAFMGSASSSELVAQLDPVTAFLLLTQPVLTDPVRREQVLQDLKTLAQTLQTSFWKDGLFWGTTAGLGTYGGRHSDFGHSLKAYWALLQIDKRLEDHPFRGFLEEHLAVALRRAHDEPRGRWAQQPTSATGVRYGNDWWSYAESDQLAATLALGAPEWLEVVAGTAGNFVTDFVDRTRPARELVPSIRRDGSWVAVWGETDTAKCNQWKSGFHGAEHALVMYLVSHWRADRPAPLYFAFPADQVQALGESARPYTLQGRVTQVEDLGPLVGDPSRHKVRVSFDQLR